jgi:hypothetical protein
MGFVNNSKTDITSPISAKWAGCFTLIGLILLLLLSRLPGLEALPLHNDEGLHLSRALEVWRGHPFWDISDGKIINQWTIAVFYPQNAPVFVGRLATIFVALLGLAAGFSLVRHWFGTMAGVIAGVLWLCCPYLFFYERLALSDAEAGALIVVALWACIHLTQTGRPRDAILTGLFLALATLFKFTAAPFAITITLIVLLTGRRSLRQRIGSLLIIGVVGALCVAIPVIYATLHSGSGFSIALNWLGGLRSTGSTLGVNLDRLGQQLIGLGAPVWSVLLGLGLVLLIIFGLPQTTHTASAAGTNRIAALVTLTACLIPLLLIIGLGSEVMPRHFVVGLPILLVLGGAGLGRLLTTLPSLPLRAAGQLAVIAALTITVMPFFRVAYSAPDQLPLPSLEQHQYLIDYSSGYGLREAVLDFPNTISPPTTPIVASMYADGCHRANFYDPVGFTMRCTDAPGLQAIQTLLKTAPVVYVLAENPPIGLNMASVAFHAVRVKGYPRPGETEATASVALWRVSP